MFSQPDNLDGFTLVELILVILLVGILSVTVVPRWVGQAGYNVVSLRDQLVTRLRYVQLANMNEPADRCTWLMLDSTGFAHGATAMPNCSAPGLISSWTSAQQTRGRLVSWPSGLTVSLSGSALSASGQALRFDRLGRPLLTCANGCTLQLSQGTEQAVLQINAEGYVYAK